MLTDFIDAKYVKQNFHSRFPMCVEYIDRDIMYGEKWVYLRSEDYTNDAFAYIMPSETHGIKDGIWISVLEVGLKGQGFGSQCIKKIKSIAEQLGKHSLCLHARDKSAKLFYLSNGFRQYDDNDNMILEF